MDKGLPDMAICFYFEGRGVCCVSPAPPMAAHAGPGRAAAHVCRLGSGSKPAVCRRCRLARGVAARACGMQRV